MQANEIFEAITKLLNAEKFKRSTHNIFDLINGDFLENDYPELAEYQAAAHVLDLDDWSVFKAAYDACYGKRKKSSAPVKMTSVNVGDLMDETEKAYGFFSGKMLGFGRPYVIWVPKSQVEYDEENSVLSMPIWLAIEKHWMSAS